MQWGVYDSMGQSGHSEGLVAMDQCSEAVVTSWGRVIIAKYWVIEVMDIVYFTH